MQLIITQNQHRTVPNKVLKTYLIPLKRGSYNVSSNLLTLMKHLTLQMLTLSDIAQMAVFI